MMRPRRSKYSREESVRKKSFTLVLRWPRTFLSVEGKGRRDLLPESMANNFIMHGYWSTCGTRSTYPPPENLTIPKATTRKLQKYWPDLLEEEPQFWEDQFCKHAGSQEGLSFTVYLQRAIEARMKVDCLRILAEAGIKPGDRGHSPRDYLVALEARLGKSCWISRVKSHGAQYLKEIGRCFDRRNNTVNCRKTNRLRNCDVNKDLLMELLPEAAPRRPEQQYYVPPHRRADIK